MSTEVVQELEPVHVIVKRLEEARELVELLLFIEHFKANATSLNPATAKKIMRVFCVPKTRYPVYNHHYKMCHIEPMQFEEWEHSVLPTISPNIKTVIERTQGVKECIRAAIFFVHSNPTILNEEASMPSMPPS